MDEKEKRALLVATGKELLQEELVARTWGNISCRLDSSHCLITPSGLEHADSGRRYSRARYRDGGMGRKAQAFWRARRAHRSVQLFPGNGVRDTHASEICDRDRADGLEDLDITDEEREKLGGIGLAAYGLPGMKKLTNAVADVLKQGIQTVFMIHHGVLICGRDRDEAMERAVLLENICRRNIRGFDGKAQSAAAGAAVQVKKMSGYTDVFSTDAVRICADAGTPYMRR